MFKFSEFNIEDTEKAHRGHGGFGGEGEEYATEKVDSSVLLCGLCVEIFSLM
jgi:hypothetical protein